MSQPESRFSPRKTRLYRDPANGKLAGVMAGLGDYFGIDAWLLRIAAVASLVLFTMPTAIAYGIAAVALSRRPRDLYEDSEDSAFWRRVRTEPSRTTHDLGRRFEDIDRRLRAAEAHVTSREYALAREIDSLDEQPRRPGG